MRDFERQAAQRLAKYEAEMRMQINNLRDDVDVALARMPREVNKLKLGELAHDVADEHDADNESATEPSPPSLGHKTAKGKKKTKRVTAASDDGYGTEGTSRTTHASRINSTNNSRQTRAARSISSPRNSEVRSRGTRSQSTGRSARPSAQPDRNNLLNSTRAPRNASSYKTPALKNNASCYSVVTPKIKPNTPLNLLRRPRNGEVVLSMQGSPLLVSSDVQQRVPNINVPLNNGNVISLLPNAGLRLSHVPDLDAETMQQLKTLKGHIDMVIGRK